MSGLLSVSEAQQKLLAAFSPLKVENVDLTQAGGRVLAQPVTSELDLPPFDNSSMDGFAVRAADVSAATTGEGVRLSVIADIPAGKVVDITVSTGEAARIMTGAPLPAGADAVAPVEITDFQARQPGTPAPRYVHVNQPVSSGENIRPKGQDVRKGDHVLAAGIRLRPQDIGFRAMLGVTRVPVHHVPRVAVFSTGDELVPIGEPLSPGKIHDANTYALVALIKQYGSEPISLGIIPDELAAVQACLDQAVALQVDLILSSAGVSVGAFDFVRHVVEQRGKLEFWRVNMRPGKPLTFGHYQGIPYVGLPGNPVSAFIGFEVFVRLALHKLSGVSSRIRPTQKVILLEAIESDGRESFLRAIVNFNGEEWQARLTGHQGSGNLHSLVQANALLLLPSGVKSLPIGAEVHAWLFDNE
jgi:molybdopterin molybdotransferase